MPEPTDPTALSPTDGPSPRRPRRADAARNARLLVAAARAVFDEDGPGAALDDVAKRAGVGNATLYRHFPTRGDLLAAAYADEVDELCDRGTALLADAAAGDALFAWLDAFVAHVAGKRDLALAATEDRGGPGEGSARRTELFDQWHRRMAATARALLRRAQQSGDIRPDLTTRDLLALANALAMAAPDAATARRLLTLLRNGLAAGP